MPNKMITPATCPDRYEDTAGDYIGIVLVFYVCDNPDSNRYKKLCETETIPKGCAYEVKNETD